MLFRCDVNEETGLDDLAQCKTCGDFFATRGQSTGYAVNRNGYERAREFLGERASVYRIPDSEDEEIRRIAHLHRKHKHKVVFLHLRRTSSSYLFHIRRHFTHTAVFDRGSNFLIYADTIINPSITATNHRYECITEARLLLGPKFHICDPRPPTPPSQEKPSHLLLNLSAKEELAIPILEALEDCEEVPEIHVLCRSDEDFSKELFQRAYANLEVHPVRPSEGAPFPFQHYPIIITEAGLRCLDFARAGLFYINLAGARDQLEQAYALNQLGMSPSLGWFPAKKRAEIRTVLQHFLEDPERRAKYVRKGPQSVDGRGLYRIAHFIPQD